MLRTLLFTPTCYSIAMSTNFEQLFVTLVAERKVDVLVTGTAAESLRTSLVRRWSRYKSYYSSLGFLTAEDEAAALSASSVEIDGVTGTRFELRPKARRNTYTILAAEKTHG